MTERWDETWHRLLNWTDGQGKSERLAAQILLNEGYKDLEPIHPLGGKDGSKDAICSKNGEQWIMAVYFPRGQQSLSKVKGKFKRDLVGVEKNNADGIAFVTNQELKQNQRVSLLKAAEHAQCELFHLERLCTILDQPRMAGVRLQFLGIDYIPSQSSESWVKVLPDELKPLISLELTTSPPISRNIAKSPEGQFWLVYWDCTKCTYRWEKITEDYAAEALQPVARYRNLNNWRELF